MKSVFSYIDFRRYLSDYYQEKKLTTRHFSYRYFASKAGIASPVFLKLVCEGKRNLSRTMIPRFAGALGLGAREAKYFEHLVLFNQAQTAIEKQEHYAVLVSMMGNVPERQVERDQYEYFSHWYTPVIRELVCSQDYQGDWDALAAAVFPPIRPKEAHTAVELLRRLKLIERADGGGYRQTVAALHGGGELAVLGLRTHNREMVQRALEAIDAVAVDKRHASGITAGISTETYHILEAEIAAFKDRIVSIVNRDHGSERVYQLNIQLFPLSVKSNPGLETAQGVMP